MSVAVGCWGYRDRTVIAAAGRRRDGSSGESGRLPGHAGRLLLAQHRGSGGPRAACGAAGNLNPSSDSRPGRLGASGQRNSHGAGPGATLASSNRDKPGVTCCDMPRHAPHSRPVLLWLPLTASDQKTAAACATASNCSQPVLPPSPHLLLASLSWRSGSCS